MTCVSDIDDEYFHNDMRLYFSRKDQMIHLHDCSFGKGNPGIFREYLAKLDGFFSHDTVFCFQIYLSPYLSRRSNDHNDCHSHLQSRESSFSSDCSERMRPLLDPFEKLRCCHLRWHWLLEILMYNGITISEENVMCHEKKK